MWAAHSLILKQFWNVWNSICCLRKQRYNRILYSLCWSNSCCFHAQVRSSSTTAEKRIKSHKWKYYGWLVWILFHICEVLQFHCVSSDDGDSNYNLSTQWWYFSIIYIQLKYHSGINHVLWFKFDSCLFLTPHGAVRGSQKADAQVWSHKRHLATSQFEQLPVILNALSPFGSHNWIYSAKGLSSLFQPLLPHSRTSQSRAGSHFRTFFKPLSTRRAS